MAEVTDALARQIVQASTSATYGVLINTLTKIDYPLSIPVSPPEGFSFYGLNPADFIGLARSVSNIGDQVAVIGIRSIGVTLSAVVAAALDPGGAVDRISVRPSGHPYDRVAGFSVDQVRWIHDKRAKGSRFLIVDEGPGRSGSTFLSVAEALTALGVGEECITLLGTREPVPGELCASNAAARWNRFRFVPVQTHSTRRFQGCTYLGGGEWRKPLMPDPTKWPACWPQMERSKFLSQDGKWIFKFEGLGRIGEEVRERARALAQSGFGCEIQDAGDGYSAYRVVRGRPLAATDFSNELLERIARYCALRDYEFRVSAPTDPVSDMVRFNVQQEFGLDWTPNELPVENLIVCDGRMQPHEWLLASSGEVLKSDAASHGDDHFFPGPIDVLWDLAGAIVEWNMNSDARDLLLNRFGALTGRRFKDGIDSYCVAYSVFRMGICRMAIPTTDEPEQARLRRAYAYYRQTAERLLQASSPTISPTVRTADGEQAA